MSAAEESNAAAAAPAAASAVDLAVTVGVIVVAADADDKRRREVATAAAMAAAEAGSASTSMGRIGDTTPEMLLLLGRERSFADSSAMPSCSRGTRLLLCRCTDRPATGAGGGVLPTGVTEKGIAVRRGFELLGRISMMLSRVNVPAAAA